MKAYTDRTGKTHLLKQNTKGKWIQFFGSNEKLVNDDWYWCPINDTDKELFLNDFLKTLI